MKFTKSFLLGTTVAMALTTHVYGQTDKMATTNNLNSTEIGTLATIAVIDKNEILLGEVASNKQNNSGIADFAKMMVDQHSANLNQVLELANSMHVSSLTGGESEKLSTDGRKALITLGGLQGGDQFNKNYIDAMVKGHQAALDLIDKTLMKTAKSDELKKFLTDTRATVAEHLDHAKKLQEQMKA